MNIYHSLEDFKSLEFAVVTSGTFDGVHLGHQTILSRINEIAQKVNGESVLITYWPHPRLVLYPDDTNLKLLNTFEEKAELLREQGIQHLLRIPFTKEFAQLTSEQFIQKVLINTIGTKKLVIGYDHRFGNNREGRFDQLVANSEQYGFTVEEISKQTVDSIGISSTKIRKALLSGQVKEAHQLLGRSYSISGRVIKGEKLGRMIGFPTANLEIDSKHKLVPADGSYAVLVHLQDRILKGMLNIGYRPTVNGKSKTIEVHIFDFNEDLYGQNLKLSFIEMIREEVKFSDIESLKTQLGQDKKLAEHLLKNTL